MDSYTSECVNASKSIIHRYLVEGTHSEEDNAFSEYSLIYHNSNENNKFLLRQVSEIVNLRRCNRAMAVMSSGDHAFNLIQAGVNNVDTFDVNKLTEYYALGLKRAMILHYSLEDYINVMDRIINENMCLEEEAAIIYELFPFMDKKYKEYWVSLLEYTFLEQKTMRIKKSLLSCLLRFQLVYFDYTNNYLDNEACFERFKRKLSVANITFKSEDIFTAIEETKQKYDIIMLSNILDYFYELYGDDWSIENLLLFEEELLKIMNHGGIAIMNYLSYYIRDVCKLFSRSVITEKDIPKDSHRVIEFDSENRWMFTSPLGVGSKDRLKSSALLLNKGD